MNYSADVRTDKALLIGPTQVPQIVQNQAAEITGLKKEVITVNLTRCGGGFGRRLDVDYAVEAIILSKMVAKPVQVVWTREDDFRHDRYNPRGKCIVEGVLDGGKLKACSVQVAGQYWDDSFPTGLIPDYRLQKVWVNTAIPIGAWRGPGHVMTAFFNQSFLDEMAHVAGIDSITFQLRLLGEEDKILAQNTYGNKLFSTKRMRNVMRLVAEKSRWFEAHPPNRFRGFAFHYTFGSYAAEVVTIGLDADGKYFVDEVFAAVDCGRVVNLSEAIAQIEGGVGDGISTAMHCAVHIENGAVKESNFHDYPVMRIGEAPRNILVHFVESDEHPMGLGEVGLPPVIPALCNAIFQATGKRIRNLPIRLS